VASNSARPRCQGHREVTALVGGKETSEARLPRQSLFGAGEGAGASELVAVVVTSPARVNVYQSTLFSLRENRSYPWEKDHRYG
jgi:hypothetical protein